MAPALAPGAIGQEIAACALLGCVLGAARAILPTRGRAAFLPDILFIGSVLLAAQSYAAGQSQTGQLRGYMLLAAFGAAGLAEKLLRPVLAAAERLLGRALLAPLRLVVWCASPLRAAHAAAKARRHEKRTIKKQKKSLQTIQRMLYNSNVSE